MKTKVLVFLSAACLVALAAWFVDRNDSHPDLASSAQSAQGERTQANGVAEKYQETVHKGLEYLVKNQSKDGHWEGDGGKHPVAMTGLVGLALLVEKNEREGPMLGATMKYSANVDKAADWLMAQSQPGRNGLIFSEHPSETTRYMEGHGLATIFLAGVCRFERHDIRRKKLTDVITRAVKYIVRAQSSQGGWYHTSTLEGHDFDTISATVIQTQALHAAEKAGIPVPGEANNAAQAYLKMAIGKVDGVDAKQNRGRLSAMAAALAGSGEWGDEACKKWLKICRSEIPVGRDIKLGRDDLIHYYYAQAEYMTFDDAWNGYRKAVFDHLERTQNKDGSWPAGEGISVGPVYSTALWCTVLQLDRNSHPSAQRVYATK